MPHKKDVESYDEMTHCTMVQYGLVFGCEIMFFYKSSGVSEYMSKQMSAAEYVSNCSKQCEASK